MSILTVSNVAHAFGALDLFRGVSGSIPNDGKVGLVGPNGVGKTTLLLILAGQMTPSAGAIQIAKGTRIGYLPQESAQAFAEQEHTVYDELLTVFAALRAEENALRQMEQEMAKGDVSEELLERYSQRQAQFELRGGYDYPLRIQQVLTGLGFSEEQWQLPLPHLSGGQKTRVLLARLLLEKPDLLILDEPTNHLDVAAIEWLEGTLTLWEGAVLIVSHDRYFLDSVATTIWELSRAGMETYRGNYSAYVSQRETQWARRRQTFDDFMSHVDKEMDYIRRNIAGQRTQMAQGKLSRLAREVAAVLASGPDIVPQLNSKGWAWVKAHFPVGRVAIDVGELQEQINELQPPRRPLQFHMRLNAGYRSGELVLRTQDLHVGYPGNRLFAAEDIELRRTECAALIGPNGAGKTTFLKTILEQLPPLQGEVKLGASLEVAYFAQAHDQLNSDNTVLDELLDAQHMLTSEARNYLARFLFRGDDVYKKVSALSGGERGRLALAILSLQGANLLLLDEPTNHLDIPAQEALQEALAQFSGTILMVTHDRYLVDRLATQVWELRNGRLRVYDGNYRDYLAARTAEKAAANQEAVVQATDDTAAERPSANGNALSKNEQRRRAAALAQLEDEIHAAEQKLAEISAALQQATEAQTFDKIQNLSAAYADKETELAQLMQQWETMADG